MRFIVGTLVGLGLGALVSMLALTTLAGCSCPPGYDPPSIAPGTYTVLENADAGAAPSIIRFTQATAVHTFTRDTTEWQVSYRIIDAR